MQEQDEGASGIVVCLYLNLWKAEEGSQKKPVISVGPGLAMEKIEPEDEKLLSGSDVTSELVAEILNDKFTLGLPLYRIEQDFASDGVRISRHTMDNWVIRFSQEQFSLIYG